MPPDPAQANRIADQALALAGDARVAFLQDACGGDTQLLAAVHALVQTKNEDLAAADTIVPAAETPAGTAHRHPSKIAHFTIRREIGSGGMGTVYEGVQDNPRRKVAIKVMRSGVTSRTAQRRFEFESQVLARLHHQGIAQIYEAGTWDDGSGGVPWFAMEYIGAAKTLTEYANRRNMGTRDRLQLFTKVCDAVSHGHQKGIIHRDLKPGNILVDANGQPKVIDFGVARATDSDMAVTTLQTDVGQLLGTVQYMSPEQCEADPDILDTRSDVYSLGVILYELLCDALPYDLNNVPVFEAARVIRERAPSRPSTIDRTLRGDVETIVMKALQKERDQRYQSAHELQRDIQRYLDNEPIEARPPSITYQLKVFAKRNRVLFASAAVISLILVAATVVSTTMAVRAMHSADVAREAEARMTEELHRQKLHQAFLMHVLALPTPRYAQGRDMTAGDILEAAGNDIDAWYAGFEDVQGSPELAEEMHVLIGNYLVELGQVEAAEQHLLPALASQEDRLGRDHWKTMHTLMAIAQLRLSQGEMKEADAISAEVEVWARAHMGPISTELLVYRLEIIDYLTRYEGSIPLAEEILARLEQVQFDLANNGFTQEEIELRVKGRLAKILLVTWQFEQDPEAQQQKIERGTNLLEEVIERGTASPDMGSLHPVTLDSRAMKAMWMWARGTGTQAAFNDAIEESRRVLGEKSMFTMELLRIKGSVLYTKQQFDESTQILREVIETMEGTISQEHPLFQEVQMYLGRSLARSQNYEEAEVLLRKANEVLSGRLESDHVDLIMTRGLLGMCLCSRGMFDEGLPLMETFINQVEDLVGPTHRETMIIRFLIPVMYFENGVHDEAFERMESFLAYADSLLPADDPRLVKWRTEYGDMFRDTGNYEQARDVYEQAMEEARVSLPIGNASRWSALADLLAARIHAGDIDGAMALNDEILGDARSTEPPDPGRFAWGLDGRLGILEAMDTADGLDLTSQALPSWQRVDEVDQLLQDAITQWWDDAELMNLLAWGMATEFDGDRVRERYPNQILHVAQRACELTHHEDANNLDTLARVYFIRGDLEQALALQEQAVELPSEATLLESLQETLLEYREALKGNRQAAGAP